MERRPVYYAARFAIVGCMYVGGWVAVVMVGESWLQLLLAALLAVAFTQVALVAHDLAHRQVFRSSRRATENSGLVVGNLLIGMSYGWWTDKHTRHHANPNHEEHDPDVSPDVLLWSEGQVARSSGLAKFIGRWQAFLFFPLLTLEGMNLHVGSFRALRRPWLKRRGMETTLLVAHVVIYLAIVFTVLPFGMALAFVAVNQAVFGVYLGCTFAPNHKGMEMLTGDDKLDFLRKQVLTSRNVSGGRFIDVALGGLNHQIEHHLFPSMAAPNLRKAKPIVKAYCAEIGVSYHECGLIASYAQALGHMHRVGAPLRAK